MATERPQPVSKAMARLDKDVLDKSLSDWQKVRAYLLACEAEIAQLSLVVAGLPRRLEEKAFEKMSLPELKAKLIRKYLQAMDDAIGRGLARPDPTKMVDTLMKNMDASTSAVDNRTEGARVIIKPTVPVPTPEDEE